MSAVTIVIGATSALNTLVAQSYGSGDLPAVRAHFSRLAFICTVLFFGLLVPLMLHAELILVVVLRQNAEVARLAGRFLLLSLPALFARFVHTFLMRFFQSLDVTAPAIISAVWGVVLDLALNLLFFLVLQWQSLDAIAVAFSIAHSITAIIAVWLSWRHEIVRTVGLWPLAISRRELLSRWGEFIGLAVPSVFQTLAWVSAVEFTILLAGLHKTLSQDAFGVLHFLAAIGGSLAGGLEGATCTRVGQHVGASDWRLVRVASNASLLLSLIGGLLLGTSCLVLGEPMLHLFTNQKPVIKLAASMLNYVVALGVLATLLSAAFGALRGLGSYWVCSPLF